MILWMMEAVIPGGKITRVDEAAESGFQQRRRLRREIQQGRRRKSALSALVTRRTKRLRALSPEWGRDTSWWLKKQSRSSVAFKRRDPIERLSKRELHFFYVHG